jgi:hypothetical protein
MRDGKEFVLLKNFIKWLAENSTGTAECSDQKIRCGSHELSYTFAQVSGQSDPLSIQFFTGVEENSQCEFIISDRQNKKPNLQFIKKLNQTPFFYSLLNTEDMDLYIVDFYRWQEPVLCIRFFLSISFKQKISLEKPVIANLAGVYQIFEQIKVESATADINVKGYVYIISTHSISAKYKNVSMILSTFYTLTSQCQKDHISHYFRTGENKSMAELDWFWSQQKYINPDLTVAKGTEDSNWLLISYLAEYFGWRSETDIGTRKQMLDKTKDAIIDIPLLYKAFVEKIPLNPSVYRELNQWWMLYSLPLMERKFNRLMNSAPLFLTLLALLVLQYQLSWQQALIFRLLSGTLDPFYKMIIWLSMRILIRTNNRCLYIYPGFYWDNNIKEIQRKADKINIKCTKYGKRQYVAIYHDNQRLYQADHRLLLVYMPDACELAGTPLIPEVTRLPDDIVTISLKFGDKSLIQSLVFRKGEVYFSDLRFRWILKKRRFQITLISKTKDLSVMLNDSSVEFSQSLRKKYYLETSRGNQIEYISLLDHNGAILHKRKTSGHRQLLLEGWALDKNRVFYDAINYSAGFKQHSILADSGGRIAAPIKIPAVKNSLSIIIKGVPRIEKSLAMGFNSYFENLLFFQSGDWPYPLEISIETALIMVIPKIRSYFLEAFAFVPVIRTDKKCNMHLTVEDGNEGIPIGRRAEKITTILQVLMENIPVLK